MDDPLHELLVGNLAHRRGWIDDQRLTEAIQEQVERQGKGEQVLLGKILVGRNALTEEQLKTLLAQQNQYHAAKQMRLYGQLAVANKMATPEQVDQAIEKQKADHRPIGEILVEQGTLDAQKHQALLKLMARARVQAADVRLGQAAVRARMLNPLMLQQMLLVQQEQLYQGKQARLGDLLVERKLLTREQLANLAGAETTAMREHNRRFGAEAIRQGLVTQAIVQRILDELDHGDDKQAGTERRLADLLVARKILTPEQRSAVQVVVSRGSPPRPDSGRWVVTIDEPGRPSREVTLAYGDVVTWIHEERIADNTPIRREMDRKSAGLSTIPDFAFALAESRMKGQRELAAALVEGETKARKANFRFGLVGAAVFVLLAAGTWYVIDKSRREKSRLRQEQMERLEALLSDKLKQARGAVARQDWIEALGAYEHAQRLARELSSYPDRAAESDRVDKEFVDQQRQHHIAQRARGLVPWKDEWITVTDRNQRLHDEQMRTEGKVKGEDGKWISPQEQRAREMAAQGRVLYKGKWLTAEEKDRQEKVEQGLIEYRGKWITSAEKDRLAAEEQREEMALKGLFPHLGRWFAEEEIEELKQIDDKLASGYLHYNGTWLSPNEAGNYVQVTLHSGQVFKGYCRKKGESLLELRTAVGRSMVSADQAQELKPIGNEQQQFIARYRAALATQDLKALLEVARLAKEQKMASGWQRAYQRALRLDPGCDEAGFALGLVRVGDEWIEDRSKYGLVMRGKTWISKEEEAYRAGKVLFQGRWFDSTAAAQVEMVHARRPTQLSGITVQSDVPEPGTARGLLGRAVQLARDQTQQWFVTKRFEPLPPELFGQDYEKQYKHRGDWLVPRMEGAIAFDLRASRALVPPYLEPEHLMQRDPAQFQALLLALHSDGICQAWENRHPTLHLADVVHNTAHLVLRHYLNPATTQVWTSRGPGGPRTEGGAYNIALLEGLAEHLALSHGAFRGLGYHDDLFRDDLYAISLIAQQGAARFPGLPTALQPSGAGGVHGMAHGWAAFVHLEGELRDRLRILLGYQAFRRSLPGAEVRSSQSDLYSAYVKWLPADERNRLEQGYQPRAMHLAERTLQQTVERHALGPRLSDLERKMVGWVVEHLLPPLPMPPDDTGQTLCVTYNDAILLNPKLTPRQRGIMAAMAAELWLAYFKVLKGHTDQAIEHHRRISRLLQRLQLPEAVKLVNQRAKGLAGR